MPKKVAGAIHHSRPVVYYFPILKRSNRNIKVVCLGFADEEDLRHLETEASQDLNTDSISGRYNLSISLEIRDC